MKLFCRHCWKFVDISLFENNPHISAVCSGCDNFIKHLNKSEKAIALKHGLKVKEPKKKRRYTNRQPYGKKIKLQKDRPSA
jgi:hypothetical protein